MVTRTAKEFGVNMEIYKARKLQNRLFCGSSVPFKMMRTRIFDDKLYYIIYHKISESDEINFSKKAIDTLNERVSSNIEVHCCYMKGKNIPDGMYMIEFIEVD